jgi:predicted transcriptional regulator
MSQSRTSVNGDIEAIIQNIIKRQNCELIKDIAKEYNLDSETLLQKYNTPSFYGLISDNKIYKINYTTKSTKSTKGTKSTKSAKSTE